MFYKNGLFSWKIGDVRDRLDRFYVSSLFSKCFIRNLKTESASEHIGENFSHYIFYVFDGSTFGHHLAMW